MGPDNNILLHLLYWKCFLATLSSSFHSALLSPYSGFLLDCASAEERESWVQAIEAAIPKSKSWLQTFFLILSFSCLFIVGLSDVYLFNVNSWLYSFLVTAPPTFNLHVILWHGREPSWYIHVTWMATVSEPSVYLWPNPGPLECGILYSGAGGSSKFSLHVSIGP